MMRALEAQELRSRKVLAWAVFLLVPLLLLTSIAAAQGDLPPALQKLKEYELGLAASITVLLAFFAGLITLTSPCGFALLPTFFAVAFKDRKRSLAMALSFSFGLLGAFMLFGIIAGILGNFFNVYKLAFATLSGIIIAVFGFMLLFNLGFSLFDFRLDAKRRESIFGVATLGFFFGVGWTPCVGPILAGILLLAANTTTVLSGIMMLLAYGIGIAVPLIILAALSDRYDLSSSRLFRGKIFSFAAFGKQISVHSYNLISGSLLLTIGILMIMFQGTFFFQTELPKVIPWSMSLWGYLNERALEWQLFSSTLGNMLGAVAIIAIGALVRGLARSRRPDQLNRLSQKKNKDGKMDATSVILIVTLLITLAILFFSLFPFSSNDSQDQGNPMGKRLSRMEFSSYDKTLAQQLMDANGDGRCDVCGMTVEQCIDSGQIECNMGRRPAMGVLGSQHIHADWKIYINGESLDWSGKSHMERMRTNQSVSSFIHVDSGAPLPERTGDIIHMHATRIPLWVFFNSLGMELTKNCLTLSANEQYCTDAEKTLKFYVNRVPHEGFEDYVFEDLDKILISYGDEGEEEILGQLQSITDFASLH